MGREVDDIKQRLNIVEIVQEYLQLKRAGSNFKGLCPFHQENSPSFMVSEQKQIYHCFGCHKGGDVFSFVQEVEGIEFYDALKILAQKAGVTISKQTSRSQNKKQPILEVLEDSAKFFNHLLIRHEKGQIARDYLSERQVSNQTIENFKLGYSPDSWDALLKFLLKRGHAQQNIINSGMVVYQPEKNKIYDRFRNRFMIPLSDTFGSIVGFTARALEKDFVGGKYINTPQTDVYDKSNVVFGLDKARQSIKEKGSVVIVEGNMDVISSHQAGVLHVVAVSGTAFTEKQITILKRYTNNFVFAFDADQAGLMAAKRSVQMALSQGVDVSVVAMPEGLDPDDCIKESVEKWKTLIEKAVPAIDYFIDIARNKYDLSNATGKKSMVKDVLDLLEFVQNPVERDHYLQKLSQEIGTSMQSLQELLQPKKSLGGQQDKEQDKSENIKQKENITQELSAEDKARREVLAMHLYDTDKFSENLEEYYLDSSLYDLYKSLQLSYSSSKEQGVYPLTIEGLQTSIPESLHSQFIKLQLFADQALADLSHNELAENLQMQVVYLKRLVLKQQLQAIQQKLIIAERARDHEQINDLSQKSAKIFQQLSNLG